eukprot:5531481-Prymnesium_polylepis.3
MSGPDQAQIQSATLTEGSECLLAVGAAACAATLSAIRGGPLLVVSTVERVSTRWRTAHDAVGRGEPCGRCTGAELAHNMGGTLRRSRAEAEKCNVIKET